ncbi:LPXTG cell wall anchor domain-containing protein [Enterococcus sp. AZ129]|uniref:LPXTG cell wall anchor domain-containing protein n=1 Tax=unclassified Enterococcus TaxID=2608891 RepID=UPI003F274839
MKKWLIGGLLCSTLLMGSVVYAAEQPSTDVAQTGVTVQLARPIGPDKLPGGESSGGTGGSNSTIHTNTNSNANANAQMNIAIGGSSTGRLPHTNGEKNLMYSILGGVFLGCSLCLLIIRKNKEKEVEE